MATFYLDYEGGNDANDGLSFANRWKTITAGATAARIAPGDTIRIMGSPAPTSLGINATWTNKNNTVTLASALNALITDCENNWTAAANVTCSLNNSAFFQPSPRVGTNNQKIVIAGAFGTGLVAHFPLGATFDYSGYQGITFWIYQETLTLPAATLSIRLCSDAAGAVTVDTLAIPAISQTGQWVPVHIDKGSALGASIQSIALYADADPGAMTLHLDNISTTKAAGNDCLTLKTLIGKSAAGSTYHPIRSISGTTLLLDISPRQPSTGYGSARGYYGTTETVATSIRKTIDTDLIAASDTTGIQSVQENGTAGNYITYSGGWDRTNMSTQTLETWFSGQAGMGRGIYVNGKGYIKFDQIFLTRYSYGFYDDGSFTDFGTTGGCGMWNSVFFWNSQGVGVSGDTVSIGRQGVSMRAWNNGGPGISSLFIPLRCRFGTLESNSNGFGGVTTGIALSGHDFAATAIISCNNYFHGVHTLNTNAIDTFWDIGSITVNDNGGSGFILNTGTTIIRSKIGSITSQNNTFSGVVTHNGAMFDVYIGTVTMAANGSGGWQPTFGAGGNLVVGNVITSGHSANSALTFGTTAGHVTFLNSSLGEALPLGTSAGAYAGHGTLRFMNYDGVAGDHRIYVNAGVGGGIIRTNTADRRTASGFCWQFEPISETYIQATMPLRLPLARIAVNASALVTIKVWIKRDNTGITAKLVCRGGQIGGVAADVVATASGGAGSYAEETITFTPSEAGVVEIEAQVYGGTTYKAFYDDMTILQA